MDHGTGVSHENRGTGAIREKGGHLAHKLLLLLSHLLLRLLVSLMNSTTTRPLLPLRPLLVLGTACLLLTLYLLLLLLLLRMRGNTQLTLGIPALLLLWLPWPLRVSTPSLLLLWLLLPKSLHLILGSLCVALPLLHLSA